MSALTIAGNAVIGSVTTKFIDSLVGSKFTQRNDKKRWLREKKLNLFSELTGEVGSINCDNLDLKQKTINSLICKIILLTEDKDLETTLRNYIFILDEYDCYKGEINLISINSELTKILKFHTKEI